MPATVFLNFLSETGAKRGPIFHVFLIVGWHQTLPSAACHASCYPRSHITDVIHRALRVPSVRRSSFIGATGLRAVMCHSGQESRQAANPALRGEPTARLTEGHRGGGWFVPHHAPPRTSFHYARRRQALPPASHHFSSSAPPLPPRRHRLTFVPHSSPCRPPTVAAERQGRASGESLVKRSHRLALPPPETPPQVEPFRRPTAIPLDPSSPAAAGGRYRFSRSQNQCAIGSGNEVSLVNRPARCESPEVRTC